MAVESHKKEPEQVPNISSKEKSSDAPLVVPEVAKPGETRDQLNSLKTELGDEISGQILEALERVGVDANEDGKLPEGVVPDKSFLSSLGKGIVSVVNTVLVGLGLKEETEETEESVEDTKEDSEGRREAVESKDFGELLDPKAPVFSFPKGVKAVLTSVMGHRTPPKTKTGHGSSEHKGYDFGVPENSPIVLTAEKATVKRLAVDADGAGNYVVLDVGGAEVYFMHLRELPNLKKGQVLEAGDLVAYSGDTGNSSGPHLHFEVRQNGTAISPEAYLQEPYHKEHEDEARVD